MIKTKQANADQRLNYVQHDLPQCSQISAFETEVLRWRDGYLQLQSKVLWGILLQVQHILFELEEDVLHFLLISSLTLCFCFCLFPYFYLFYAED